MARQHKTQCRASVFHPNRAWRIQLGELPGLFESRVLGRSWLLRRAHALPLRKRVTVTIVDAKVPQANGTAAHRKIAQPELNFGSGPIPVIVMIIPDEYAESLSIKTGQCHNIRLGPHALL